MKFISINDSLHKNIKKIRDEQRKSGALPRATMESVVFDFYSAYMADRYEEKIKQNKEV